MEIEYWESAVDEIMHQNNIEVTPEQIQKLGVDFASAASVSGEYLAPVYTRIEPVKVIELEPKSSCCDAKIISKTTGLLNGGYSACSICKQPINVIF